MAVCGVYLKILARKYNIFRLYGPQLSNYGQIWMQAHHQSPASHINTQVMGINL